MAAELERHVAETAKEAEVEEADPTVTKAEKEYDELFFLLLYAHVCE